MVQKADSGRDHRWSPRRRLAVPLDDRGVGHAAALTHRLQRVPAAALVQGVVTPTKS